MRDADPRRVVMRFMADVLNGADTHGDDELIADETLKVRTAAFRAAFPDAHVTTQHVVVEGAFVAVHFNGEGTHHGLFQGCPPTGRSWAATGTALLRVADGRIVDSWVNWDLLSMMEQLGCVERTSTVSA